MLFDPAPAITGTRPPAASTAISTTRRCSAWLSVGLSPVVPTGTIPSVPWPICQSTKAANASSSTDPSSRMGVIRATSEPLNM